MIRQPLQRRELSRAGWLHFGLRTSVHRWNGRDDRPRVHRLPRLIRSGGIARRLDEVDQNSSVSLEGSVPDSNRVSVSRLRRPEFSLMKDGSLLDKLRKAPSKVKHGPPHLVVGAPCLHKGFRFYPWVWTAPTPRARSMHHRTSTMLEAPSNADAACPKTRSGTLLRVCPEVLVSSTLP